jgi:hypothetical protein
MFTFRESRRYGRNPAYQTVYIGTPFIRGPGSSSPYNTSKEQGGANHALLADKAFVLEPEKYGFINQTEIVIPAAATATDQLILPQPTGLRVHLLIINTSATQTIYVAFGQVATVLSGIPILAGNNLFYDNFVPQDEVHVTANGGLAQMTLVYSIVKPFAVN